MKTKVLYTARELADILHCHPQTIYRLAYKGLIKSVKVGSLRRFEMPKEMKGQNNDRTQSNGNFLR